MKIIFIIFLILLSKVVMAEGYDIFGVGYYDIKFDGSSSDNAIDYILSNQNLSLDQIDYVSFYLSWLNLLIKREINFK